MRIAVLCRKLDGKPTNGFERYSQNLVDGLTSSGVEPLLPNQRTAWDVRPSGSLISPPYYDIVNPLIRLVRGELEADVFHAVTDSQALLFPWLRGKKVLTMHHVDKTPADSGSERVFRAFYGIGTRIGLRQADQIICISTQTKKEVMETYGISEDRISLVPQAVPGSFRPLPGVPKQPVVGYIGALKKRKNVEFLVRAFAAYRKDASRPPLRLVICGEGSDRGMLEALAGELGVAESVEFRPPVPEEELVETYNSFSLFVLPSIQEGFGFPIIEASACGVPVLTMAGALIPEEVARYTIRCTDERDMAEKMEQLMRDRERREKVIREGIDHAATFSVQEMGARTVAVYQKVQG